MNEEHFTPRIPRDLTIRLVGLGGIGGPLARYLGLMLASAPVPTRLVLIEGDVFEEGNRSRQWFRRLGPKAEVLREELLDYTAGSPLTVLAVPEYLTPENIERLIPAHGRQVVALCVDNHKTRRLVAGHVARLAVADELCTVSGGNDPAAGGRTGTYGNVQVHIKQAAAESAPLTRWHPEIEHPKDFFPHELSCNQQLERSPQVLAANVMVAALMFWTIQAYLAGIDRLPSSETYFDLAHFLMRPAAYPPPAVELARATAGEPGPA